MLPLFLSRAMHAILISHKEGIVVFRMDFRRLTVAAMLAAVSGLLMIFDFPLWFAPPFYKLDFSEVPVLIGSFACGPLTGVVIELLKNLIKLCIKGTETAFVGELAAFAIGCALAVPAGWIYKRYRTFKGAVCGMGVGVIAMTVIGCLLNIFVILPAYAAAFHIPMDQIVKAGTVVNPNINSLTTFILFATAPFNLFKGTVVSLLTALLYKRISFQWLRTFSFR